jgi:hypothetical protein
MGRLPWHIMKKWTLILVISCLILMMVACPGLYDSHTKAVAFRHYSDAPSDATLRELQDAKKSDRWHILIYELVLGGLLAASSLVLIRVDKNAHDHGD